MLLRDVLLNNGFMFCLRTIWSLWLWSIGTVSHRRICLSNVCCPIPSPPSREFTQGALGLVAYVADALSFLCFSRFGKTLFFEHPITNPFSHEERFLIEFDDTELRLVTNLDEWMELRHHCR